VAAGADAIGLVFAPSARQVTLDEAMAIRLVVPSRVEMVGVFVNEPFALVHDAVLTLGLGGAQFHRDPRAEWSSDEILRWKLLRMERADLRLIHALRAKDADALELELSMRIERADQVLLDAYVPGLEGGTGKVFDWSLVDVVKRDEMPVIVAGGLTPENVADAVRRTRPWGVDVSSGVEAAPGRKDHDAVRRFIANARAADVAVPAAW
jgi:phosphoribosylanthranilate isomerase